MSSRDSMRAIAWAMEPSNALELDQGRGASLLPALNDRYLFSPGEMRYSVECVANCHKTLTQLK